MSAFADPGSAVCRVLYRAADQEVHEIPLGLSGLAAPAGRPIGIDDEWSGRGVGDMESERFVALFHEAYLAFHRRSGRRGG